MKKIVVIPVYKNNLTKSETASLRQCIKVLNKYDICIIAPENLNTEYYEKLFLKENTPLKIIRFNNICFSSIDNYSRLLLDVSFYKKFAKYDYMFLYQLDGWVFKDELDYWCIKDYDYIGAPWFEGFDSAVNGSQILEHSGNGGVSLRKIPSFIRTLSKRKMIYPKVLKRIDIKMQKYRNEGRFSLFKSLFKRITSCFENKYHLEKIFEEYNEDYVIVNYFSNLDNNFKIAPKEENYKFSFEVFPRLLYKMNNEQLPFACHAFQRYDWDFWKDFINF